MEVSFSPIESPVSYDFASRCTTTYTGGLLRASPSRCALPSPYKRGYQRVLDFEVRDDDVWIISYPKCGTAWTQEMVWLLMKDLDYESAKKSDLFHRAPFVELQYLSLPLEGHPDWIDYLNKQPSPRCIKSHLHKELLPRQLWTKKPKIIYVARNPKDVVLSDFYHHQTLYGYKGTIGLFTEAFVNDLILFSPFWKHLLDFWNMKDTNILYNTYEEMKEDLPGIVLRTSKFLNKNYTDEQLTELAEHLSFNKMKENPAVNYREILKPFLEKHHVKNEYMRKGESGSWKTDLPPEAAARIDAWSRRELAGSDYPHYE